MWDIEANRIREAVRRAMWDPDTEMFSDVDPSTGRRTGVKAAVCFYPYFTDIVDESHLHGLEAHLFNPHEFWTPFPIPSTAVDDPSFSAAAHWKGERKLCAWNGRVWPMTNSHIAEAIARSAIRFRDAGLRLRASEFMARAIRMMFHEGDPARPNSFEHYHPFTGAPSAYRGIDDYQHPWIADLIASYVCGLRPAEDHMVVDPFPFGLSKGGDRRGEGARAFLREDVHEFGRRIEPAVGQVGREVIPDTFVVSFSLFKGRCVIYVSLMASA